jgi:hypothetical protein
MRLTTAVLISGAVAIASLNAQSVLSVHSGVVHYVEGDAYIGDKLVESKFGQFPEIKEGESFRTEAGRAEILLTPGSFLRVAENSEVRMISNHLSDTRFELVKGEILVESVDSNKDSAAASVKGNMISVLCLNSTTTLLKPGLYQFTTEPGRVRVYDGEAAVKLGSDQLTLKKGKETQLQGALMAVKFDEKTGDELMRWSSRRSGYLAMANVTAARTLSQDTSQWNSYLGSGMGFGNWAFNPLFGMYTYVPFGGIGYSPFGYNFWSPYSVFNAPFGFGYGYYPGYYGYGYGGYGNGYTGGGGGGTTRSPLVGRSTIFTRSPGHYSGPARAGGFGSGSHGSGSGFGGGNAGSTGLATTSSRSSSAVSSGGFGGGHSGGGGAGGHH